MTRYGRRFVITLALAFAILMGQMIPLGTLTPEAGATVPAYGCSVTTQNPHRSYHTSRVRAHGVTSCPKGPSYVDVFTKLFYGTALYANGPVSAGISFAQSTTDASVCYNGSWRADSTHFIQGPGVAQTKYSTKYGNVTLC